MPKNEQETRYHLIDPILREKGMTISLSFDVKPLRQLNLQALKGEEKREVAEQIIYSVFR
jgi:predicted type IV restriction endonuclease